MNNNNQYYASGNNQYYQPGGNNAYYGGNNAYYGGNNAYYQGNQQYYQQDPQQENQEEEGAVNFNPVEWLFTFLHYWYLFVIGLAIALGLAMLKNRRWIPSYYSQGTIIIKESSTYGGSATMLMQGFVADPGLKNVNNQMIMLGSYDLISRVVDSLPFMETEYITQGRFKTRQLYRQTPILVEHHRIDPKAFGSLFQVSFRRDGSLQITSTDEGLPLEVNAHYGEPVHCDLFDIVI